ncbi:MAG: low temperature requirement protein A [Burkholderiales bacterium]|nr:low temperature requirement protein A [Burkholderiales bacterium]
MNRPLKRPPAGRDIHEAHRASTPLELLFDLCFAIGISVAASNFAHAAAQGRIGHALFGFGFSFFAVWWAWMNFTWYASAYDNDDGIHRLLTLTQILGALIMATGIPDIYAETPRNGTVVVGYATMRVALVAMWLRAARGDPARRRTCLRYATTIALLQLAWIAGALFVPAADLLLYYPVLLVAELAVPVWAERAGQTPWHPHHIADRYAAFAIIVLGEGLVGTVAAIQSVQATEGWSFDLALVGGVGTALTFCLWWIYFIIPHGAALAARRAVALRWGYGSAFVFASLAAMGSGLHVAADAIGHPHAHAAPLVLALIALPILVFELVCVAVYAALAAFDGAHLALALFNALQFAAVIAAAAAGAPFVACLALLLAGPLAIIAFDIRVGARRRARALQALAADASGHPAS